MWPQGHPRLVRGVIFYFYRCNDAWLQMLKVYCIVLLIKYSHKMHIFEDFYTIHIECSSHDRSTV